MLTLLFTKPVVVKELTFDISQTETISSVPLKKAQNLVFTVAETEGDGFAVVRSRRVVIPVSQTEVLTPNFARSRAYAFPIEQLEELYVEEGGGGKGLRFVVTQDEEVTVAIGRNVGFSVAVAQAETVNVGTFGPPIEFSAATNSSAVPPAFVAGDFLLAFSFLDGTNAFPTVPPGWTAVVNRTGNSCGAVVAYKIAQSSSDTISGWTNAASVLIHVYKNVYGIGAVNGSNNAGQVIGYPSLALKQPGDAWVVGFSGHRTANANGLTTPPSTTTFRVQARDTTDTSQSFDTNGPVNSWINRTHSTSSTSSGWTSLVVELLRAGDVSGLSKNRDYELAITQSEDAQFAVGNNHGFMLPVVEAEDENFALGVNKNVSFNSAAHEAIFVDFVGIVGLGMAVNQHFDLDLRYGKEFFIQDVIINEAQTVNFELTGDDVQEVSFDVNQQNGYNFGLTVQRYTDPVSFDVSSLHMRYELINDRIVNLVEDHKAWKISRRQSTYVYDLPETLQPIPLNIKPILPPGVFEEYFDAGLDPELFEVFGEADANQGMLRLKLDQLEVEPGVFVSVGSSVRTKQEFGFGDYDIEFRAGSTSETWDGYGAPVPGSLSSAHTQFGNNISRVGVHVDGAEPNVLFSSSYHDYDGPGPFTTDYTPLYSPETIFTKVKIRWLPDSVEYYVNGNLTNVISNPVPDHIANFVLSHEGSTPATANQPRYFYVRYFRFTPAVIEEDGLTKFKMRIREQQALSFSTLDIRSIYRKLQFLSVMESGMRMDVRRRRNFVPNIDQTVTSGYAVTKATALKLAVPEQQLVKPAVAVARALDLDNIAANSGVVATMNVVRQLVMQPIAEAEVITSKLARSRGNSFGYAEAEALSSAAIRARRFSLPVSETEALSFNLNRSRVGEILLAINQTQSSTFRIRRVRQVTPSVPQTQTMAASLYIEHIDPAKQKVFGVQINQVEVYRPALNRRQLLRPTVAQVEALNVANLSRLKPLRVLAIQEAEGVGFVVNRSRFNAKLNVAQVSAVSGKLATRRGFEMTLDQFEAFNGESRSQTKFTTRIDEVEAVTVKVGVRKSFQMTISETEMVTGRMSYVKPIGFNVPQVSGGQVAKLISNRGMKPTISEVEQLLFNVGRMKQLKPTIAETESFNIKLARVKRLMTAVKQIETITPALTTARTITEVTTPWMNSQSSSQLTRSGGAWTNLQNIRENDGLMANQVVTATAEGNGLYAYNFQGMSVPTGATILGIEFRVRLITVSGLIAYNYGYIAQNQSFASLSSAQGKELSAPDVDGWRYLAGLNDVWGGADLNDDRTSERNWAATDFNSNLALYLQLASGAAGLNVNLDAVQARLKYLTVTTVEPPVLNGTIPLDTAVVSANVTFPPAVVLGALALPDQVMSANVPYSVIVVNPPEPPPPPPPPPTQVSIAMPDAVLSANLPFAPALVTTIVPIPEQVLSSNIGFTQSVSQSIPLQEQVLSTNLTPSP